MPSYTDRPNLHPQGFDHRLELPYGLRVAEVRAALEDIYDFLYNVNRFLTERGWERLEETLMAATFSGVISEMVVQSTSKQSASLIRNQYHNGRPDLLPRGRYPNDAALRAEEGVEVKASRNEGGWQGHNVESGWIMIFQYQADLDAEPVEQRQPTRFVRVLLAQLDEGDWSFSGRREGSRRTITASILRSGKEKLLARPLYLDPTYEPGRQSGRRAK
ncbi:MAG: hypothetical protein WD939_01870 [Dehalococcoidia bacterium]